MTTALTCSDSRECLDALVTLPDVPHLDEVGGHSVHQTRLLGVAHSHNVIGVPREGENLLPRVQVPDLTRAI